MSMGKGMGMGMTGNNNFEEKGKILSQKILRS